MTFGATHIVGGQGAAAWHAPDAALAAPRLDPNLPVQVLETQGNWARVLCENGWETWVDARGLTSTTPAGPPPGPVPAAGAPPTYPAAPTTAPGYAPAAGAPSGYPPPAGAAAPGQPAARTVPSVVVPSMLTPPLPTTPSSTSSSSSSSSQDLVKILSGIGAVLSVLSGFVPWLTFGPFHADAWDLYWLPLLTNDASADGPKVGLVLCIGLLALVTLAIDVPGWALIVIGAIVGGTAMLMIFRLMTADAPRADVGLGTGLAILAGGLIVFAGLAALTDANGKRR